MYIYELPNEGRRMSEEVKRIKIYVNCDDHGKYEKKVYMYLLQKKIKIKQIMFFYIQKYFNFKYLHKV